MGIAPLVDFSIYCDSVERRIESELALRSFLKSKVPELRVSLPLVVNRESGYSNISLDAQNIASPTTEDWRNASKIFEAYRDLPGGCCLYFRRGCRRSGFFFSSFEPVVAGPIGLAQINLLETVGQATRERLATPALLNPVLYRIDQEQHGCIFLRDWKNALKNIRKSGNFAELL